MPVVSVLTVFPLVVYGRHVLCLKSDSTCRSPARNWQDHVALKDEEEWVAKAIAATADIRVL